MIFKKQYTKTKKGLSMLELILVLGIIGSAAAIIFVQYSAKNQALNNLRLSQSTVILANEAGNILSTARDEAVGFNLALQIKDSLPLPAGWSYNAATGALTSNIGTTVTITGASIQGPNGLPTAIFTFNNLPKDACAALTTSVAPKMYSTTINGSKTNLLNNFTSANVPEIARFCSLNKTNKNTVQMVYLSPVPWGTFLGKWQGLDLTNPANLDATTLAVYNNNMALAQKYRDALAAR